MPVFPRSGEVSGSSGYPLIRLLVVELAAWVVLALQPLHLVEQCGASAPPAFCCFAIFNRVSGGLSLP